MVVLFRPVGSAPLLKQTKFKISSSQRFQAIADFLYRQLLTGSTPEPPSTDPRMTNKCGREGIYLYINSSFAPAADEMVGNLFACFAVDSTLIVNYSLAPAWG